MTGRTDVLAPPQHWRLRPVRTTIVSAVAVAVAVAVAIAVGAAVLWWPDTEWSHHRPGMAVTIGGWRGAIAGGAAMALLMNTGLLRGEIADDGDGIMLSPSRSLDVIARIVLVVMAVSGIVGIVVWWRGGAEMAALSTRQHDRWLIGSALVAALGVSSIRRWFSRLGPLGSLRLSPFGIEYRQGWCTVRLAWQDITDVTDEYPSKRKIPCPITFRSRSAGLKVFVPGAFGRNPARIYWMIQHYWRHPEDRAQLSDGQAQHRLRRSDFRPG